MLRIFFPNVPFDTIYGVSRLLAHGLKQFTLVVQAFAQSLTDTSTPVTQELVKHKRHLFNIKCVLARNPNMPHLQEAEMSKIILEQFLSCLALASPVQHAFYNTPQYLILSCSEKKIPFQARPVVQKMPHQVHTFSQQLRMAIYTDSLIISLVYL